MPQPLRHSIAQNASKILRIAIKALKTPLDTDIALKNSGRIFRTPTYLPLASDFILWYNDSMTTEIITAPNIDTQIKRLIASSLSREAETTVPYSGDANKDFKKKDILATILWDIVIEGHGILADGTKIVPESYSDWFATVKYLVSHLDGPAGSEEGLGTNVFKVYVGVDVNRV